MVKYPSVEKIIELNLLALSMIRAKKADQACVLSRGKLSQALEESKNFEGDIYDKAVILLKGIVQKHAFASGNRRTAFLAAKYFLMANKAAINLRTSLKMRGYCLASGKVIILARKSRSG